MTIIKGVNLFVREVYLIHPTSPLIPLLHYTEQYLSAQMTVVRSFTGRMSAPV